MAGKGRFHLECKAAKNGKKGELMIYSSIYPFAGWDEDNPNVTSRSFDRELKTLEDADEITVRINSPGGAVTEAIAIRTMLMKHRAAKLIEIEGECASAATLIACIPGAKVRMAKGSEYMIHRSSWIAIGHAADMLSAYESLTNTDNEMADIYAERTGKSRDEALELMDKTTWYTAEQAVENGFADEVFTGAQEEETPVAACCEMSAEPVALMRDIYGSVPEGLEKVAIAKPPEEKNNVSNEKKAVAAGSSSENIGAEAPEKGVNLMELREATAEMIQQENPAAAQEIAQNAVAAERARQKAIMSLKPRGAKWDAMAKKAIDEGDSEADFLRAVIAEQEKTGEEYLENRRAETEPAEKIGAGDIQDVDGRTEEQEIDAYAKEMAGYVTGESDNKSMF